METASPELERWMKAQSDYARGLLMQLPLRGLLLERLRAVNDAGPSVDGVTIVGERTFYFATEPGKNTEQLYVREGKGEPRLLLDPDTLARDGNEFSLDYVYPSPKGKYVAIGLAANGTQATVLHVLDVGSGRLLPEAIDRTRGAGVSWQANERSFFYRRLQALPKDAPPSAAYTRTRAYLHVVGTAPERDRAVFGYGVSPEVVLKDDAFSFAVSPATGSHVFGKVHHGTQAYRSLYFAPRGALPGGVPRWKLLCDPTHLVTRFDVRGDDVYLLTNKAAPRGQVIRVNLMNPDLAAARLIVPEGDDVITDIAVSADALYVHARSGVMGTVRRVPFDGGAATPIPLPSPGTLRMFTDPLKPGVRLRFQSWTFPLRFLSYEPTSEGLVDTGLIPLPAADFSAMSSSEVTAKGEDGTLIPLSIVHPGDLQRDGNNPVLLTGYAAYGYTRPPVFDPVILPWLEQRGVYAVCHARGGGEHGEAWHRAGQLEAKPNSIADFIACARYLLDQGYTSPALLGAEGESAGGIMVAGAVIRRPDLFGAAVISGGMLNALRFAELPIGPFSAAEFGDVATPSGFHMLSAIDAYHQVKAGTAYPSILLTVGANDRVVSPWQSAKMVAKLQAANPREEPALLLVGEASGHAGVGATKTQTEEEAANKYAFLLARLRRAGVAGSKRAQPAGSGDSKAILGDGVSLGRAL